MKKNPIVIFTGLAVAAVAGLAGLTYEAAKEPSSDLPVTNAQPAVPAPADVSQAAAPDAPEPAAKVQSETSPAESQTAAAQPAAEPSAVTADPAVAAPATTEAQQIQTVASAEPPKTVETPASVEGAATAPAGDAPSQAAAVEPPAADPDAPVEQPVLPALEQPIQAQPEVPKSDAQPAADPVPTFDTVRVEKTGEAVIAGQAEPGSKVEVKLNGETIGETTASADGSFVVVPEQPLPAGSGAMTIEAQGDGDIAPSASEQVVAVIVPEQAKQNALIAVVSPDQPTKVLQKPKPEPAEQQVASTSENSGTQSPVPAKVNTPVSLDSVDYDAAGNIVFSGRGEAGSNARIYVDNSLVGDAAVGADGNWSFSGTTHVAPGVHQLRIDSIAGSGKVLSRIEAPFFREETEKVASAPEAPVPEAFESSPAADKTDMQTASGTGVAATSAPEKTELRAAASGPKLGRLVIQPGNNLWRISRVIYGSGTKYALLYEANKELIRDPDLIYPGQVFRTPEVEPPETIDPALRDPLVPAANP